MLHDFQKMGLDFQRTKDVKIYNELYFALKEYLERFFQKNYSRTPKAYRDDAITDTLVTLWLKIDDYNPAKSSFQSWVTTIASRNLWVIKRYHKIRSHMSVSVFSNSPNVDESIMDNVILEDRNEGIDPIKLFDLEGAIERLPELYRNIVWDKYIEGLSYKEMAPKYGCPVNTLKTRAREGLRRIAEENGTDRNNYRRF